MANSDSSVLQETILKAMDAVVTQRNNELKLDKTITAIVKKNVGVRNNRALYEVEYEGGRLTATAQNSTDSYIPNTSVYVLVPQGNFSNEKIIIGRASTISTDRSSSVVAAAANSYSIIGANLVESTSEEKVKNIEYGLHSFHDHATELSGHPADHRFQVLYDVKSNTNKIKFNDNRLNIYKDQTTALMLKAEFQTNLDIEQRRQSNARYGLIFNFSFDNLNKGFGETNGEIFENLAPIVEGKVIEYQTVGGQQEFNTVNKTLADYHTEISGSDFSNSILDMYIEYIQTLYNDFLINKKKLNTELISNLITAYLNLLNELKDIQIDIRKAQYEHWWSTEVGEPGQKIEQFVLTSDMMIGNPLSFSQWNAQYTVFTIDMNTFNHVESIYFFKEGFIENEEAEKQWPLGNDFTVNPYGEPDIFVKNIQIYAMKPLEAQSGDYSLKVEPYGNNDFILSAATPSTQFKATVLRQLYEDLTYNDKTSYYWFKESPAIINSSSDGYNYLAGVGWKYLNHTESKYLFSTTIEDNPAYKNNYKCVAVYEPAADNKTILAVTFTVYNEDAAIKMKLESDIGTDFSFDQGIPTIKVLIHNSRMQEEEYAEIGFKQDKAYIIDNITYSASFPKYRYTWAITDAVNGQKIFLADTADSENFLLVSAKQALLDRISHFTSIGYYDEEDEIREVEDTAFATRIKYPVYTTSSGFTVDCYLQERKPVVGGDYRYYDVGSAQLEFKNQNENLAASDFRVQIVNGDQVFQYDEYGNAPTVNKLKEPLEIQPLQAKLISRSGLEIEGSNYNVEWIFPIEDTLITTTETLVENSASQLIQSYYARECNFGIQEIYNPSYYNNQITCHISFNDIDLYKDTNFYFGKIGNNGTNGTDFVAKIEYAKDDDVNLLHYEPLTLYVQKGNGNKAKFNVRDADGNLNNFQSTKTLINLDTSATPFEDRSLLKLVLYQKNIPLGEGSYASGYPRWNIAGNAYASGLTSSNNTGKFFELASTLSAGGVLNSLTWNYDFQNDNKHFRIQNLQAEVKVLTGETYYAYFSLPIIEYEEGQNLPLKLHKDTIAIDKPTYLNEIVYNADGRNPIYNHNAGLKLINLPEGATVEWVVKGGFGGRRSSHSNSIESIAENTPNISLLESRDSRDGLITFTTTAEEGSSMVYVLPADEFDGSSTNNRIEAKVSVNGNLIATVYAPINMILNTFGLASVNAWDGNTITIDNERGAVLAPQVAAGEKDDNNRFTGIVMGKTETYTGGGDNQKQIGLFGYHKGLQSIFLDSDTGNATFGLPDVEGGHYKNTSVQCEDDYNEGRIELRPGDISKVGGWRLGRRSLYYTMTPKKDLEGNYIIENNSYVYDYSGKIGPKYQNDKDTPKRRQYGEHHEKDIYHEDSGILLSANPSYISVVGGMLTSQEISEDANGHLTDGDAIEMQLDPKTPTVFTIFRHNGRNRGSLAGTRTYLAGINSKGQLQANSVGSAGDANNQTTMYIGRIKAFEQTINEDPAYVGSVFEAGDSAETLPFLTMFVKEDQLIQNGNINKNAHVYMTGGNFGPTATTGGENYGREISLHAKSLDLYAKDSDSNNKDKKITDANIKISTDSSQIQLGDNVGLLLNRKNTNDNYLKTSGIFNLDVGVSGNRKNLTVNAAVTSVAINGATINNAGNTGIINKGTTTVTGHNSIIIQKQDNSESNPQTLGHLIFDATSGNRVQLGIPEGEGRKSLITLTNNGVNSWDTIGTININSTNSGSAILIHANYLGSGVAHNSTTAPQLELRAGQIDGDKDRRVRLLLSSSNNNWVNSNNAKGIPFEIGYQSRKIQMTVSPNADDTKLTWEWMIGMNQYVSEGLKVNGAYLGQTVSAAGANRNLNIDAPAAIRAGYFVGNGKSITNTADGSATTGNSASISGWGSSGTASFAVISMSNGRPNFSTRSISVSIPNKPTLSELGGVTESRVSELISNALQNYVKKENAVGSIVLSGTGSPGEISYGWNTVSGSYISGGTAHVAIPQNTSGN